MRNQKTKGHVVGEVSIKTVKSYFNDYIIPYAKGETLKEQTRNSIFKSFTDEIIDVISMNADISGNRKEFSDTFDSIIKNEMIKYKSLCKKVNSYKETEGLIVMEDWENVIEQTLEEFKRRFLHDEQGVRNEDPS